MYRDGAFPTASHHLAIESAVEELANSFEEVEHLGTSLLPLPYAQITRIAVLLFLLLLPVARAEEMGGAVIVLSFLANWVYFAIDASACAMEGPFGSDRCFISIQHLSPMRSHPVSA